MATHLSLESCPTSASLFQQPIEVTETEFKKNLQGATLVGEGYGCISSTNRGSIISYAMETSVTLFGIQKNLEEKIESIFAYQILDGTEEFIIQDVLNDENIDGEYKLCIIESYVYADRLINTICSALRKYFNNNQLTVERFPIYADRLETYFSASLDVNGKLAYWFHNT